MIVCVTQFTDGKDYCLREFLAAWRALKAPKGEALRFVVVIGGPVSDSSRGLLTAFARGHKLMVERGPLPDTYEGTTHPRNRIAAELRERARKHLTGAEWVFWFDSDVLVDPDALLRLLAHRAPVASGVVMDRSFAPAAMAFRLPLGCVQVTPGPQEVDWVGFGCVLARGDLVGAISWQPYLDGEGEQEIGEDGYWCLEAAKLTGRRVRLDGDVRPLHVQESGLAGAVDWNESGRMIVRPVRVFGEKGRGALYSTQDGESPRFGRLQVGQPITEFDGRPLTEDEMERFGRESEFFIYAPAL